MKIVRKQNYNSLHYESLLKGRFKLKKSYYSALFKYQGNLIINNLRKYLRKLQNMKKQTTRNCFIERNTFFSFNYHMKCHYRIINNY